MNLRALEQYLQLTMERDLIDAAQADADSATATLIADARAQATADGENPDVAEALVEPVRPVDIGDDVPSLNWCGRIAKKHAKAARGKVGKMKGLKKDLLERVRKDPDKNGKRRGGR
jgi:hypothetical protein